MRLTSRRFSLRSIERAGGFSLLETMVSASLMALVLGSIYVLLVAGMRYHRATATGLELQQDSLHALMWLTREIGETNPRTILVFNNPPGLLFASPRDRSSNIFIDNSGMIRWPKFICYFQQDINGIPSLVRKEQYLDHPDLSVVPAPLVPPLPLPKQTLNYYRVLAVPVRSVAHNVSFIRFSGINPIKIELTVARTEFDRSFETNLTVKVRPRN